MILFIMTLRVYGRLAAAVGVTPKLRGVNEYQASMLA